MVLTAGRGTGVRGPLSPHSFSGGFDVFAATSRCPFVCIHSHAYIRQVHQSIPSAGGRIYCSGKGRVRRMGQWEGWGPSRLQNTPQRERCEQNPGSHPGPDVRWRQPRSHVPRTDHGPRLKLGRRGRWEASCQWALAGEARAGHSSVYTIWTACMASARRKAACGLQGVTQDSLYYLLAYSKNLKLY